MTSRSDRRLAGRVAVVTGGGRGIGLAACIALAREGARVAPLARTAAELDAAARAVRESGGEAPDAPIIADVTRPGDLESAAARVESAWGPADILVLAAGKALFRDVRDMSVSEWDGEIAVNLSGAFYTVKAFLPRMIERGTGDIVGVGSVASVKAFTGCGAYGAAKHGLRGFLGSLREEVRGAGVRVTTLVVGATETGIWGPELPAEAERLMRPESVADAVVAAITADPRSIIEEVVIRPVLGDL